ncbi:hypothetical protein ABK040_015001 [Willaertia magna]
MEDYNAKLLENYQLGQAKEKLKQNIKEKGIVIAQHNILKVDSFVNHQVDPLLAQQIGLEFAKIFKEKQITKVLTIEASGITFALMTSLYLNVPTIFAKKTKPLTMSATTTVTATATATNDNTTTTTTNASTSGVYTAMVKSYTKNQIYEVCVGEKYLTSDDRVLIIDDFLASGNAINGLITICDKSKAKVCGVGIVIEKLFQSGRKICKEKEIPLESLIVIEKFENGGVVFKE